MVTASSIRFDNLNLYASKLALYTPRDSLVPELSHFTDNVRLWFSAPSALVSVDGVFACVDEVTTARFCIVDSSNNNTWLFSRKRNYSVALAARDDVGKIGAYHHVEVKNNRLLKPIYNKHAIWFEQHNVKVKQCADIEFDNLRHLCLESSEDPVKNLLIFIMETLARKKLWMPVYRPEIISVDTEQTRLLRLTMSERKLLADIPKEELAPVLELLVIRFDSIKNHYNVMDWLLRIGVLDFSGLELVLSDQDKKHLYQDRLRQLKASQPNQTLKDTCFTQRLQKEHWCEQEACLALAPVWLVSLRSDSVVSKWANHRGTGLDPG